MYHGNQNQYSITIRPAPKAEEQVETPKPKRKSYLIEAFTNRYMAAALLISGVATSAMAVLDPGNPRSGIGSPAECEVSDIGNKRDYHFRGGEPEDVLNSCAQVFNHKGFKLGKADVTSSLTINDLPGMDGKIGSPFTSYSASFEMGQDKEAKEKIEQMAFDALDLKMQWYGKALTPDWVEWKFSIRPSPSPQESGSQTSSAPQVQLQP